MPLRLPLYLSHSFNKYFWHCCLQTTTITSKQNACWDMHSVSCGFFKTSVPQQQRIKNENIQKQKNATNGQKKKNKKN
jgi:hypothetical protein